MGVLVDSNVLSVVIVGAGPAGFYAADALLKKGIDCQIDFVDYLPTPYGLIRAGVAPDHQTTKKVSRSFEKIALNERCEFFGNVHLGRDISVEHLKNIYDVVIVAVGADADNRLGIPGDDKKGVIGSATFVSWYNAHPDFVNLCPDLDTKNVVILGNGNVAIDVARVLVKTRAEMSSSDLPEYAGLAIENSPITDVYMIGRRGPIEAKFTNVELREMGELTEAVSLVKEEQLPDSIGELENARERRLKQKNLDTLKTFAKNKPDDAKKRVHFGFWSRPLKILGDKKVEAIEMEETVLEVGKVVGTGKIYEIDCGLVIPAIGYKSIAIKGLPFDSLNSIISNIDGRVEEGVYVVGWIKRGPSGVISTNRPDGVLVADHISADFTSGGAKTGRKNFKKLLNELGVNFINFEGWKMIEEAESKAASEASPRKKIERIDEMIAIANANNGK